MVTLQQIQAGVVKFIDSYIAPKATGFTKFMIYFVTPSLYNMIEQKYKEVQASNLMPELFNESGNLNLDETFNRAKTAIQKSGKILIPGLNYFADEEDLTILYELIKKS